jgi:predicted short-subunit dehydrogenase-like oxidoreductase (DUF2520 family)
MSQTKSSRGSKPTVSVVGSGRLGTALAIALESSAYSILALVAQHPAQARKATALLGRPTLALGANQIDKLPHSDFILITTPDDAIADAARQLAVSQKGVVARGRTVLHTSGALSSDVLSPLADAGFHVGSIHPLVSVSDARTGAEALRSAFYCVEGDKVALRVARSIVRDLKGEGFSVSSDMKALYHAAAVMASGHFVAQVDIAVEMLFACGLNKARAREVLLPLLRSTVENLSNHEPARALTGTFARGDAATVQRHLAALRGLKSKDALAAYILLGRRSVNLARTLSGESTGLRTIASSLNRADRDLQGGVEMEGGMNLAEQPRRPRFPKGVRAPRKRS